MKSLNALWLRVLNEFGTLCCVSTDRDRETYLRRVESEGIEFLTLTLPQFGKDFERSLEDCDICDPDLFVGWNRRKTFPGDYYVENIDMLVTYNQEFKAAPRFLSGFMDQIFDSRTGALLVQPNIDAIIAVRQLTLMYGKLLIPCSDARVEKAIAGYIEIENEVRRNDASLEMSPGSLSGEGLLHDFKKASLVMWGTVLQQIDEDVYYGRIIPRHGPGATADRLTGNSKFDQLQWTERLERIFPFGEFALPNWRYQSAYSRVEFLSPGAEKPVKVITVPKTAKAPRIIAVEPTCMQYVQQGLLRRFVEYMETANIGPFSFGGRNRNNGYLYVGFESQIPNQNMAQEGSLTGEFATLDLSEASDRVSWLLVKTLLSSFPNLQEGVAACRSRRAHVPGHGVIRLAKFASMGSALTFPIEAMVFSTVVMMAIASSRGVPVTSELCEEYRGKVRVYGDDIIVPVDSAVPVYSYLELFGFKVNSDKSFWTGRFRESCGREFFDGHDVSIVRCRRMLPTKLDQSEEVMSFVSLRNQLYQLGLWTSAAWCDELLEPLLRGFYPLVLSTSPVLGRESAAFGYETQREHSTLHSPLVRGFVARPRKRSSPLSGLGALVKYFLKPGELPFADKEHLRFGGRPKSVDIRLGWKSPF